MDDLERRLKEYNEYNRVQISGEFLQRLKELEARPAARQPRRRYVLPLAAVIALALCLGSLWAWTRFSRPEGADTPNVTLEDPADADGPAAPSEPAQPETKPESQMMYPGRQPAGESASPEKPAQGSAIQPNSGDPASARSEETAPAASNGTPPAKPDGAASAEPENADPGTPEDATPVKPDDPKPVTPDDPSPAEPDDPKPVTPDEPNPPEPDDPKPQEPDEPDQPGTEGTDLPASSADDPPQIPPYVSPYGAVYLNEGGRETLTVTHLATGERMEIDVTGRMEQARINAMQASAENQEHQPGETPVDPEFGGSCIAFGTIILYQLKLGEDGTVYATAFDPLEYAKYYAQYHPE